jgi:hypothetical protein
MSEGTYWVWGFANGTLPSGSVVQICAHVTVPSDAVYCLDVSTSPNSQSTYFNSLSEYGTTFTFSFKAAGTGSYSISLIAASNSQLEDRLFSSIESSCTAGVYPIDGNARLIPRRAA